VVGSIKRPVCFGVSAYASGRYNRAQSWLWLGVRNLDPTRLLDRWARAGWGEVYRARDTRLDRTVAIKILPAQLSSDSARKQRFEREAKTISSLNHPHICVLHDIGHQDGIDYLVMECVEGETLAKRLEKGPLPVDQVLKFGAQIADALDKAHRSGVVHRDLKPANIMLTPAGAKLLDFGLAKPVAPLTSAATLTATPAKQSPATEQGTIVGTFQYMSPEQIEGKELDGRSDLFSLGAVLYEMLTGQRAFQGKSQLSVASAILEKEPVPISTVKPMTPPALDHAILRCLAKDSEERWQTARDLALELKWIAELGSQVTLTLSSAAKGVRGRRGEVLLWGVASLILATTTAFVVWNLKPSPPRRVTRTVITLPPGQRLAAFDQPGVALSPDDTHLAYVAIQGSTQQQLYLRAMDSLDARAVPGTEGATAPFFSPDGQWLGFFSGNKLKKVPVGGGPVQTLGDAVQPRGGSWSNQGMIAFATTGFSFLRQLSVDGGVPLPLTRLEKGEGSHRWPEYLLGGKAVLFSAGASAGNWLSARVTAQSVGTGERRDLTQMGTQPRYSPSGHVVYAQGGNLMAAPFDPQRLAITGAAVPVVEGVLQSSFTGAVQYSISAAGSLIYVPGSVQASQRTMVWVGRNGAEQSLPAPAHAYRAPRLSPDGRRVAVGIEELEAQVWLYDASREALTRFTLEGNSNLNPIWTPDGKRIAFQSTKEGPQNIFWQLADGNGGAERLTTSDYLNSPTSWSPDGRLLAYFEVNPTTGWDIWVLNLSDRKARPFLRTPFNESVPRFSPDGHWIAYISNESGRFELYVQPYPGPGGKWQISTEGGTEPAWNPNGRELFYRSGNKMMAVDIATQPSFSAGKPRVLFEGRYEPTPATFPNYDVSRDGQRFLMLKPSEQEAAGQREINVVLNWSEELKQRVPVEKK
jgi:Tol biopolymer transport system component